ncbi:ATP-dependent DNA helicase RecG [Natronincola ferrireducens]|uniref:ATP-dependent DNA helicase RecG n=1 Tax=Natronincola ferrireducens TaxID=393762 RepID=A0A1G9BVD6_9FIRM|nr:ATP-dependent DNA helicase RecG [Natronincola ferrireducens]SDK43422.1 ATP-dependent DNA helicase RecG [Natronincola ferrireducens]
MEVLKKDIQYIKGVGPKRLYLLNKMKIYNVEDMLYHFPRDYENRSISKKIIDIKPGEKTTLYGVVARGCQSTYVRKGLSINKYLVKDSTGYINIVFFNQPYMKNKFKPNDTLMINGKVKMGLQGLEMTNPVYEKVEANRATFSTDGIIPIYPSTEGFSQSQIINIQKNILEEDLNHIIDYLPDKLVTRNKLCNLSYALRHIHLPASIQHLRIAKYRLVFDELFLLQLALIKIKKNTLKEEKTVSLKENTQIDKLIKNLPFSLTNSQKNVLEEIFKDLEKDIPMNRLVQGDVGSGKTVVAVIALYKAVINGCQGALMAPTEILAEQHYKSLEQLLEPLGIRVGLLIGSLTKTKKQKLLDDIQKGEIDIIIGTHALIQESVYFKRLALVVTDEQHRFGVRQRATLVAKGDNPHILVMTATPIPRTLALILYGDLDISIIDELPPGRKEIKTYCLTSEEKDRGYNFAKNQLELGRQVYIVCPLVEESEAIEAKAATEIKEELEKSYFLNYKVGLLHGKMNPKDKEEVMKQFVENKLHVLVATTVIEVGVNVPNATVMIIENAERFGLAQLHQLRGRVGRGSEQSYCILIHNNKSKIAKERMKIMEETTDGFIISEKDLEIRGPGEFFGLRQHGLPDLKIANLFKHMKILKKVQEEIEDLLKEDPYLNFEKYPQLKLKLQEKFQGFEGI